jgi:cell division septation protein DedD
MTKKSILAIMVAGACLDIVAQADEIQFTTLPETVQTTVIRETHIASPTGVVRVIHDSTGVYAVTVRGTQGDQVVYVNETGTIVQAPATTTTTTVQTAQPALPVQPVQPAADTQQTVTTYDEVQKSQSRYELLEKKGNKEIYMDHQTGQKVTVKRAND